MAFQIPPGTDLSTIPAALPPFGVVPNFENPPTLAHVVTGVEITFMVLAAVAIGTRLITNITAKRVAGIDDAFCILAFVGACGFTGISLNMTKYYRHQWDIPLSWFDPQYFKLSFASQVVLYPTTFFAKLSILLLYRRVFAATNTPRMLWLIYGAIAFTFCLYIPNVALAAWFCAPHIGEGWVFQNLLRCRDTEKWYLAQACLVVVLDLYIFILPLPTLFKLNMSRSKKISILLVFMTASLAIIAAIATLANRPFLISKEDQTWYSSIAAICSAVENYVSIIVSSAPALSCFIQVYIADTAIYNSIRSRLYHYGTVGGTKSGPRTSKIKWLDLRSKNNTTEASSKLHSQSAYINLDNIRKAEFHSQIHKGDPKNELPPSSGILRSLDVSQGYEIGPGNSSAI